MGLLYHFHQLTVWYIKFFIGMTGEGVLEEREKGLTQIIGFKGFENRPARYGLFDRHDGQSKGFYDSLNIGLSVGDSEEAVRANRKVVKQHLGVEYLLTARQVHGDSVYHLESMLSADVEVDGFDALITRQRNIGLAIQHADCQAVLLYDPEHEAIGAIHSGWRSSVNNILAKTVEAMSASFGTDTQNLQAVISPSLGPCCAEFINHEKELPNAFKAFMVSENYFDFWQISRWQLMCCGLKESAIRLPTTCTSCSEDYFSYRRACRESGGVTGRNCSGICLSDY